MHKAANSHKQYSTYRPPEIATAPAEKQIRGQAKSEHPREKPKPTVRKRKNVVFHGYPTVRAGRPESRSILDHVIVTVPSE